MKDGIKNESLQEVQSADHLHKGGNVLSIVDKIAKRNAPEKIYLCRAEVKRDRNDEDEPH